MSAKRLQAVVICDTFSNNFSPVSIEIPEILFPVCNIPLLEYTLEFLVSSDIQDIILASSFHSNVLEEYLHNSRWSHTAHSRQRPQVQLVKCGMTTFGDTMRHLDEKRIISGEFVLCVGGFISNMNLDSLVQAHRTRLAQDPNSVCTLVFKEMGHDHPARPRESDLFVGYDTNNQILLYQNTQPGGHGTFTLDPDHVSHKQVMQFRSDLVLSQIAVCSNDALGLFSTNYDYHTFGDFIDGTMVSLLGHRLFSHVISEEYASGVSSWGLYHAVSKDIIRRWVYPIAPDTLFTNEPPYTFHRACVYRGQRLNLDRTSTVGPNVVVGSCTAIGAHALVQGSVIGERGQVGANARVSHSYLWNGVEIGSGAVIHNSVVCTGAVIGEGVCIEGCIIGPQVRIEKGSTVPPRCCVTVYRGQPLIDTLGEDDDATSDDADSPDAVSHGNKHARIEFKNGWVWTHPTGPSDAALVPPERPVPVLVEDDEDEDDDEEEHTQDLHQRFKEEVMDTFLRGVHQSLKWDNIEVEILGLRHGYDKSALDCGQAILEALVLDRPPKDTVDAIKKHLKTWARTFRLFFSSDDDQLEAIYTIRSILEQRVEYVPFFMRILHAYYEAEVISEESILQWAKEQKQEEDDEFGDALLKQCATFLQWLETAESDEDDGEDEEEQEEPEKTHEMGPPQKRIPAK